MNILFISSYYLFDKTRFGGSKRLYLLAKELSKHADVSVICLDACKEFGHRQTPSLPHPDFGHFLYLPWTDSRGVLAKILTSGIIIEDLLKTKHEIIRSFVSGKTYDAAFLAFPLGLSFLGTVIHPGSFPIVYAEDDLFLEKVRTESTSSAFGPFYQFVRMKQLLRFYRKKIAMCDTVIAISVQEQEIFRKYFPSAHVELLGYGINLDHYPFLESLPGSFTLGFIGNFLHSPNCDAIHWFLNKVYPQIRIAIPGIRMVIAGHAVPDTLRQEFYDDASILWQGEVADLKDFYSGISVFVNPIVSGRGMRTKLVEAAAFGRPIVSTRLGAEGSAGISIEIAEDAPGFAQSCQRFRDDAVYYKSTTLKNRSVIEEDYSAAVMGSRLLAILSRKTGNT